MIDICAVIERETGLHVTSETSLDALPVDSLEYLDLMLVLGVPDSALPNVHLVGDLTQYVGTR